MLPGRPRRLGATILLVAGSVAGCSYPRLIEDGKVNEPYYHHILAETERAYGVRLEIPPRIQFPSNFEAAVQACLTTNTADPFANLGGCKALEKTYHALGLWPMHVDARDEFARFARMSQAATTNTSDGAVISIARNQPAVPFLSKVWFADWWYDRDLIEEWIFAHEITHALQYARHRRLMEALRHDLSTNDDELFARWALIEGEANYFGMARLPAAVRQRLEDPQFRSPISEIAGFAYGSGHRFFASLGHERAAKLFDAPTLSTRQILYNGIHVDESPIPVSLGADATPPGFHLVRENTLGELLLRMLCTFEPFDERRVAEGWRGDRYRVFEALKGGGLAIEWVLLFGRESDASCFMQVYRHVQAEENCVATLCMRVGSSAVAIVEAPDSESFAVLSQSVVAAARRAETNR